MLINKNNLVSIIVRTCNPQKFFLLEEAVKSIYNNKYRPIEIIIVAQTESDYFIQKINNLIETYRESFFPMQLVINRTSKDERAKNLNLGITKSEGRYIGFLDDDDIFHDNHIPLLIDSIKKLESTAWVYGDVALVLCHLTKSNNLEKIAFEYPFKRDKFSIEELFKQNFIPINSYLLDRNKIESNLLLFDESFRFGEDYAFLIKIAVKYIPEYVEQVTSEYRIFQDCSNSNIIMNDRLNLSDKDKIKSWSYALYRIEVIKENLMSSYSSGLISLKLRKYIFYKFPLLKIWLQYKFPIIREFIVNLARKFELINEYQKNN